MDDFTVPGSGLGIDSFITQYQSLLSDLSLYDPRRPLFSFYVAFWQRFRYELSKKREDLDNSIFHFTESILLPPLSWPQHGPSILTPLLLLADALLLRSDASKQPEDVIYATKYLFHLRDQPQEYPGIPRLRITELLLDALFLQVKLEAGDVMQNIRDLVVLSRELTLETSDVDVTRRIDAIWKIVMPKLRLLGVPGQLPDELIGCLRDAREHTPYLLLEWCLALAVSLQYRYYNTSANDEYEQAASILDEVIAYRPLGNTQDESVAEAQAMATALRMMLARRRSGAYPTPEHLEEEIYRASSAYSSSSVKEFFPSLVSDPGVAAKERFSFFGPVEGAAVPGAEQLFDKSLSPQLRSVLQERNPAFFKMMDLCIEINNNFYDDTTKVHEAIEKGRTILPSDPDSSTLSLFGEILYVAFLHTEKVEYLNESISANRQVIESGPPSYHFRTLIILSVSILFRSRSIPYHCAQDFDDALELLSQCANSAHGSFPARLKLACAWAYFARRSRHPSVSTAYNTALSLMQDTPIFSPTLQLQHATLATHDDTHSLPLDYASYRVDQHQVKEAIETLEKGRALLWSEMHYLRISVDRLLKVNPDLGCKFAAVSRDLDELTKSVPPSHKLSMDDGASDAHRAVDPFGRLLLKQRGLLKERAKLVSQIQALPSLDGFMTSTSFDTLRSAASSGPVIIINHSVWRSDIVILLHDMPPSLIPTPFYFYKHTSALKDKLLASRHKSGLDSPQYEETLAYVLEELYKLVGKPVIDRLRQLQVPEQSRIWWCPTSVFCYLPLHAMGPIPSNDGEPCYFLDLYVCSYTPTLSALIQSHHPDTDSQSLNRPSILLVAPLDPSRPTVGEADIKVVQALDTEVTSLVSEAATPATVIDGFSHHRFVHFACHGALEVGKPFEAGFDLYRDERLTLLEIVRSHVPTAEFAFLSACHTAEVTEGSVLDEGLHLAAAVQYCGFRSVVGTMWAMADEDGEDLAMSFYKALFSNPKRDQGKPYHERSAKALRSAVKKLRRKREITLERWVNFVHYGA